MNITEKQVAELVIYWLKNGKKLLEHHVAELAIQNCWTDEDGKYIDEQIHQIGDNDVMLWVILMLGDGQKYLRTIIEEKDKKISELRQQLIEKRFDNIK